MHATALNHRLQARPHAVVRHGRARCVRPVAVVSGTAKPTVLVAEKLGSAGIDLLKQTCLVETAYNMKPEELCAKVSTTDALIVRSGTKVTRAVFEAAKGRLRVVGRAGVGVDNVDLAAATEHGCLVVNAPTANTVAAAEHGIALLCALARYVPQADASMKGAKWDRTSYVGTSMVGKTLAVYGFGKVGSEVARRAKGLGMTVIAYDPYASQEKAAALQVPLVSLDEALALGDFHSLHMPLTPGTKDLFSDASFAKIKPGSRIINVARGGVISEAALARALDAGRVAGAALDVFADEPPAFEGHPLIGRPDVIVTPHLGASTTEAQEGVAIEVVEAVVEALAGKLSSNAVNAPMVSPEALKELQPYIALAQSLGRAAVELVRDRGYSGVSITYTSPRGDDLDTRLLRAMVIKGLLEGTTTSTVNLVNADLLAKNRGLKITEVKVQTSSVSNEVLSTMAVSLDAPAARFSAALDRGGRIHVEGRVSGGLPHITKIGTFDVDLAAQGYILLVRQRDVPGVVGRVGSLLAKDQINISFMTVSRTSRNEEALMAIGIDSEPAPAILQEINQSHGVMETAIFTEP